MPRCFARVPSLITVMLSNFNEEKFSLNQCYPFLMEVIFLKAFPDISHISQIGLKKLFTINKMPTYTELMEILKANEIRGYSHFQIKTY